MYYAIRHVTRFRYSDEVSESVMEARMQPRSEGVQRCLSFELRTNPKSWVGSFLDERGNRVHHFNIPDLHTHLTIRAESQVELGSFPTVPQELPPGAWHDLDVLTSTDEFWDLLEPSRFAQPTDALRALATELRVRRGNDPLTTMRELTAALHDAFEYDTDVTEADSPIDRAIASRRGVCQDFSHIMIALVCELGIPCRYVSGYLYHRTSDHDRSPNDATHAWVEALLPELGWIGFDPTNNVIAAERHIRVAVGRDYADVPPTRGIFKGRAETELAVAVRVTPSTAPVSPEQEEDDDPTSYRPTRKVEALPDGDLQEQPQQ